MKKIVGLISAVLFIGTIFAANYAIEEWGIVSVGLGLSAPAGVYFAGLAFILRDMVHITLGRLAVAVAILLGVICSYFVNPTFALASATAFLLSELVDFGIFNALITRGHIFLAILLSGFVGLVVDSIVFLELAFGNLDFLRGQIVGKTWMLLLTLPLFLLIRKYAKRMD